MNAYIVVGPTNDQPARLSCFDSIVDVSVSAGMLVGAPVANVAWGQK